MRPPRKPRAKGENGYLEGQLLVAMPAMSDKRFARSVIYMCAHSSAGAMGLIINQQATHINLPDLLRQLGIVKQGEEDEIPPGVQSMAVHVGGPVETGRGFVLHSSDYFTEDSTLKIDGGFCLTATIDILKAMATGEGPKRAILALGYAGWSPGQLEREIHANGWLHCPADERLVFDANLDSKYDQAMTKIGIDLSHLVNQAGHA
jgi:putative transcriptional regulator